MRKACRENEVQEQQDLWLTPSPTVTDVWKQWQEAARGSHGSFGSFGAGLVFCCLFGCVGLRDRRFFLFLGQGCEDLWHSMTSWFDFGLLHQEVSGKAAHGSTLWTLDVQQVWSLKITICRICRQSCTLEINNTCWSDKSICSESFRVLIVRVSCFNLPNRQTKTWKTKRCVILHVVSLPSAFKVTHQTCMLYNYITYITDQHWQVEAMQQSWMSNCWSGINKHMSFNSYIPSYQIWYSKPQSLC